jgi:8-oxo-dGTP diphosphatase
MKENIVTRAIITGEGDKVLLGRRHHGNGAGQWALIGGKPEGEETPEQTMCREVLEEIGVEFINATLLSELTDSESVPGETWKVYIFAGQILGEPKPLLTEVTEVGWFNQADLRELDIAFIHKKFIFKFIENGFRD